MNICVGETHTEKLKIRAQANAFMYIVLQLVQLTFQSSQLMSDNYGKSQYTGLKIKQKLVNTLSTKGS